MNRGLGFELGFGLGLGLGSGRGLEGAKTLVFEERGVRSREAPGD